MMYGKHSNKIGANLDCMHRCSADKKGDTDISRVAL